MVIKKYTFEKNKKETAKSQLSQYRAQAKGFLSVNRKRKKLGLNSLKSGLATVLPMAAASLTPFVGIGQACNGSGGISTPPACNAGDFLLDINGGGNEIAFTYDAGGLYMRRIGSTVTVANDYIVAGFHYAIGYALLDPINEGSGNFTAGGNPTGGSICGESTDASWVLETAYGGGGGNWFNGGGSSVEKVVGVIVSSSVGFIEVTWNNTTSAVTIGEYGVADDPGNDMITAGECSSIVPVELIRFFGKKQNDNFLLGWETASEINNAGFEVQRSTDAENFRKLAWVDGVGNSDSFQEYSYEDTELAPNQVYYYRLKQVDVDGRFEYSNLLTYIHIDEGATTVKDFAPNPVTVDFADLRIVSPQQQKAEVAVYDAMGREVFAKKTTLISGLHTIRLDLGNAVSGTHFVQVVLESGKTHYKKLVIAKN